MELSTQDDRGPGRNKRKWTHEEDEKLVIALLDLVNSGSHKAENGFKPGFLNVIEESLQASLPGSCIKAKPHIESRIKTLKRDFNTVYDMLNGPNLSGFGWDPVKKCVTAEKAVWDGYLQSHPKAAPWKNKAFPFYDDLARIFGKDRASGKHAETPTDVIEELDKEENAENIDTTVEVGLGESGPSMQSKSPNDEASSHRKRKRNSADENIITGIKQAAEAIGGEIAKASEMFSKAIGVDAANADKRDRVHGELEKIVSLTPRERIKAAISICRDHEMTDLFFSIPEGAKEELVRAVLSGDV